MNTKHLDRLTSPGFLAALGVLLLNDLLLKQVFSNTLTGKLSDFAGLFVFPLFWAVLFPRFRAHIYVSTALLFVLWKSPYSQPVIDAWNQWAFFSIGRTIDYSDLVALLVLPLSYQYGKAPSAAAPRHLLRFAVALLSVFAFAATSRAESATYSQEYTYPYSQKELLEKMSSLSVQKEPWSFFSWSSWWSDTYGIGFDGPCLDHAKFNIREESGQSVLTLRELFYGHCSPDEEKGLLASFEARVVHPFAGHPR